MTLRERTWELGEDWQPLPSGLFVPTAVRKRERPIAVDCFCGVGGMSIGLIRAGFDVVAGIDNDPNAMLTYLHNLGAYPVNIVFVEPEDRERAEKAISEQYRRDGWCGKNGVTDSSGRGLITSGANRHRVAPDFAGVGLFYFGDIRKITGERILHDLALQPGDIDLVTGSPPCQGFSMGGRRNVMDPRNSLVFDWARLVLEIMPKSLMMENVPGIVSMLTPEGLPVVDALALALSKGGFGAHEALKKSLLTSSGCGAALRGKPAAGADDLDSEDDESAQLPDPGFEQQGLWGAA